MLDRETTLQIAVASIGVGAFVVLAALVSSNFGSNNHLSVSGGFALVGGVALFVVVTTIGGLWLSRQDFEEDEAEGSSG